MKFILYTILPLAWCGNAAPQGKIPQTGKIEGVVTSQQTDQQKDGLITAASSYSRQYSNWGGNSPGGYGYSVTGFGVIDNKYDNNYGGLVGYDDTYKNIGNPNSLSNTGYVGNADYGTHKSFGGYGPSGFDNNGGYSGHEGTGGYGAYEGNGGYGGYGGNGGLNSYYGYNNPYYQGSNHLGYGYYNKRPGYGNIYNSGITPSLVTGYRGYTRR